MPDPYSDALHTHTYGSRLVNKVMRLPKKKLTHYIFKSWHIIILHTELWAHHVATKPRPSTNIIIITIIIKHDKMRQIRIQSFLVSDAVFIWYHHRTCRWIVKPNKFCDRVTRGSGRRAVVMLMLNYSTRNSSQSTKKKSGFDGFRYNKDGIFFGGIVTGIVSLLIPKIDISPT